MDPGNGAPIGDAGTAGERPRIAVITDNVIPRINHTVKSERLGQMALENRRQYGERHGYTFIGQVPIPADRPACWAKIPAILRAFEDHPWVLWADSDALIFNRARRLEAFCDPDHDLIVQSHEGYFRYLGVSVAAGLERMPMDTGVFLIRASAWSRAFLLEASQQTQFVSTGEIWNGIGEQEAMIAVLRKHPGDRDRIGYGEGLQNHPKFYRPGDTFVHFYGNHARHRIPLDRCERVLGRWEAADQRGEPFPADRARFHWCCIQSKTPDAPVQRGDLSRHLYGPEDVQADEEADA